MDFILNANQYIYFQKIDNNEILEILNNICDFRLYSISEAWRDSKEYILKARGEIGDIIISFI